MAQRETEDNAYAKFWGDKQRALWYVTVFSGVVNSVCAESLQYVFQEQTIAAVVYVTHNNGMNNASWSEMPRL